MKPLNPRNATESYHTRHPSRIKGRTYQVTVRTVIVADEGALGGYVRASSDAHLLPVHTPDPVEGPALNRLFGGVVAYVEQRLEPLDPGAPILHWTARLTEHRPERGCAVWTVTIPVDSQV